jgi:hypothetical protein
VSSNEDIERLALSKTASFRCFQIDHTMSIINDKVPLRIDLGVDHNTSAHHLAKSPSTTRGCAMGSDPRQNLMPQRPGEGAPSLDMLYRLVRLIAEWEAGWVREAPP